MSRLICRILGHNIKVRPNFERFVYPNGHVWEAWCKRCHRTLAWASDT